MHISQEKSLPTQSNQSAEKLLILIEAMSVLDEPVRLQDLAKKVSMNASTVLRFLAPLQKHGYVYQEPEGSRYHLTFKLCGIADNIGRRMDIRNVARPFLRSVAQIFNESANLSIESDMSVMYLEVANSPHKTVMAMQRIGHVAPLHCTGVGKVLMLDYSQQKIDQMIALKGLTRFTENTITNRADLLHAIEETRERGYAFDNEECEIGARCVAAPIRNYTGKVIAGISVSGPTSRMTDTFIYSNIHYLLDAAEQISHRLNGTNTSN